MIRIPKGTVPQVDAALRAVPPTRRDSWRVHRLEGGETLTELARRFNTTQASITAANRSELPDSGAWIAIPVAYPGDRMPARARTPLTKPVGVRTAAKPAAAHTAAVPHRVTPTRPTAANHPAPAARATTTSSALV